MHLRFSSNSNNLNAQVNKLHNLKYIGIMHRGLPLEESIVSVSVSSSELKFGTSVNSAMLIPQCYSVKNSAKNNYHNLLVISRFHGKKITLRNY